ncbi:PRC-barrel domain-containing protein [Hyphomicrobium sp.]|uniref:PRC-barrel domain-containing protein n=1 Tax=Hyphomicrobium sp. TaxID=82 RepID=UPI002FDEAAA5
MNSNAILTLATAAGAGLVLSLPFSAALGQMKAPHAPPHASPPNSREQPVPDVAPLQTEGTPGNWHASQLIGTTMTNVLGETIGRVEDVVIDGDGKVVAVMVGVGGFLGLGETSVAIGLRHLAITQRDDQHLDVQTSLSRRAVEQAASLDPADSQPQPPAP